MKSGFDEVWIQGKMQTPVFPMTRFCTRICLRYTVFSGELGYMARLRGSYQMLRPIEPVRTMPA